MGCVQRVTEFQHALGYCEMTTNVYRKRQAELDEQEHKAASVIVAAGCLAMMLALLLMLVKL